MEGFSEGLNLILTYRCNFRCSHCLANCSPERTETMTDERARRYIDAAAQGHCSRMIGYTGGEPFLYYDRMLLLMKYTYNTYGIAGGAVTNCFWAETPLIAEKMINELRDSGLRSLVVSLDQFHLQFGQTDRVRNAVIASVLAGVYTTVNSVVSRDARSMSWQAARKLLSLPEDVEKSELLVGKELHPLLEGRAKGSTLNRYFLEGDNALYVRPCVCIGVTPAIDPAGNFFGCCCVGDTSEKPEEKIAYVGNADEVPVPVLYEQMENNLLLMLFRHIGPYAVLQRLLLKDPALPVSGRYATNCDICQELYYNPLVRKALQEMLLELSDQISA